MSKFIHIRNLEKYNPGYTDRSLIWCKIYFTMLNSNYEFELIDDIDKWRLIALIMLELQMKKPIPYDEKWLQKKISNNKRSISLTIQMLHNFIEIVTENPDSVTQSRVDKSRIEEDKKEDKEKNDKRASAFKQPSLDEIRTYIKENNYGIDPEKFFNHYEANGWYRGKTKIKSWKACVKTWLSKENRPKDPHRFIKDR